MQYARLHVRNIDVVNESVGESRSERELKRETFQTSHSLIYLTSKLFGFCHRNQTRSTVIIFFSVRCVPASRYKSCIKFSQNKFIKVFKFYETLAVEPICTACMIRLLCEYFRLFLFSSLPTFCAHTCFSFLLVLVTCCLFHFRLLRVFTKFMFTSYHRFE